MKCNLIALSLLAACISAGAATDVFRCGNVYSQVPCAQARSIDVDDSRTDAQRASALEVAARDKALAQRMTNDRLREEAAANAVKPSKAKVHAAAASSPARLAARRARRQDHETDQGNFVAFIPGKRK